LYRIALYTINQAGCWSSQNLLTTFLYCTASFGIRHKQTGLSKTFSSRTVVWHFLQMLIT